MRVTRWAASLALAAALAAGLLAAGDAVRQGVQDGLRALGSQIVLTPLPR